MKLTSAPLKAAGYDDALLIEVVQHVALNTWTNYINEAFKTDVDFSVVSPQNAAWGTLEPGRGAHLLRNIPRASPVNYYAEAREIEASSIHKYRTVRSNP